MSATLTRHPETDAPVSTQAPKKPRRWVLVAATVALAGAVVSVMGTSTSDDSHRFAETGRHDALGRAAQRTDASSDAAEFTRQLALGSVDGSTQHAETQRMSALAPVVDASSQHAEDLRFAGIGAGVDVSVQLAETQRMASLAPQIDVSSQYAEDLRFATIGAGVDTSVQYAETQRFLAVGAQVDTSNDVAELNRMKALDDTSWEDAEARRFATLDPSDN